MTEKYEYMDVADYHHDRKREDYYPPKEDVPESLKDHPNWKSLPDLRWRQVRRAYANKEYQIALDLVLILEDSYPVDFKVLRWKKDMLNCLGRQEEADIIDKELTAMSMVNTNEYVKDRTMNIFEKGYDKIFFGQIEEGIEEAKKAILEAVTMAMLEHLTGRKPHLEMPFKSDKEGVFKYIDDIVELVNPKDKKNNHISIIKMAYTMPEAMNELEEKIRNENASAKENAK